MSKTLKIIFTIFWLIANFLGFIFNGIPSDVQGPAGAFGYLLGILVIALLPIWLVWRKWGKKKKKKVK